MELKYIFSIQNDGGDHERTHFQEARYCRLCCRSPQKQGLLPGRDRGHVRQRGVNSGVFEVAIGQAALGGIWAGCASLGWGLSSAMASTCMERLCSCHSSFCSSKMAQMSRMMDCSLGKMPTTSARRLTSLFNLSSGLVLCRKGHGGQHVVLGFVHEAGEFWPFAAKLVGDMPPGLAGAGCSWLTCRSVYWRSDWRLSSCRTTTMKGSGASWMWLD